MYKIIEVKSKKDINRFVKFQIDLYEGNKYFVPALNSDEKKIFKKNYVYNNTCKTVFYLCVDENNNVVGRIEGIIQLAANEKWKQKRVRFTRFDAINNQEVANLLLDAIAKRGKEQGMDELVGPLGYSDLEREGLLIEGFDKFQTYEEQYNFDYYQKLLENYGLEKDVDWLEYKIFPPKEKDERLIKASEMAKKRFKLRAYSPKSVSKFIKEYKEQFFEIIDITYNKIYGTVPFTKEMMDSSISNFNLILRPQDITVVLTEENKVVGFALVFPSISKVITKYKGKITPRFLIDFFKNKKKPNVIDLGLIGVLPEYTMKGVAGIIVTHFYDHLYNNGIDYMETNLMLENNNNILGFMSNFEREFTKRRRCFVKKI